MFKKLLVANRGEIATRVIRACMELDIETVAIYSEEDTTSLHVKKADEAYMVGPGPIEGYLNIHRIVDLAIKVGVDAIHPGYGFLSENPRFPLLCEKKGITFIGPSSKTIAEMGHKIQAREMMIKAGVPVLPGTDHAISDTDEAITLADEIGYPIMVKAAGGGGGRGLRVARNKEDLISALESAKKEAAAAFGVSEVFLEKFLDKPHHIEFQILADTHGNIIHLGERDCSIQRRHQKLVEITPSLMLDDDLRARMGEAAIKAARATNYVSAGTVEFLVDNDKNFYFLEMNTRIQVEHPVTEEVTGIDLLKEQIEIAAGKELAIKQEDVKINGYAMECRICAEDPKKNFMPSFGRVTSYYSPGGIGVRIDGAIYKDFVVSSCYDSLIVKLIVSGATWDETVKRMQRSLDEFAIRGIKTTIPFLEMITHDPDFIAGNFDTGYIDRKPELMEYHEGWEPSDLVASIAAAIAAHHGL
ncbi:MAG: acetyl-CoA carboxylase biotin carboxylase subunit [Proteobacteria bacterium]|nr:acetyl-CoA carboxylase biotin carboxylase subunit [Pseudomonadota bacterium]